MVLGSCNGTALQRYCGAIKFSRALDSALSRPRISHVGYERTTFAETDNMLCGAKLAATDRHTHCCCAKLTGIAASAFSPSGRFLVQHDIISPLLLFPPSQIPTLLSRGHFQTIKVGSEFRLPHGPGQRVFPWEVCLRLHDFLHLWQIWNKKLSARLSVSRDP